MGLGYMLFDRTMIFIYIGMIISAMASSFMNTTFNKYKRVASTIGMTGSQVARQILDKNGLQHVQVVRIRGDLTDHFDPRTDTVGLSETVYDSTSLAAISVAAHECGHVIQKDVNYFPFNLRSSIVPVVNFGQRYSIPILLLGVILGGNPTLIDIGIILFSTAFIFQVVTLPVEFNASFRAIGQLEGMNLISGQEEQGSKKVLTAAALTYVAGAIAALLSLLRIVILFGGNRRND